MKIYCKNCEHFPRIGFIIKGLSRCNMRHIQINWDRPKWVSRFCDLKNHNNDCIDYQKK